MAETETPHGTAADTKTVATIKIPLKAKPKPDAATTGEPTPKKKKRGRKLGRRKTAKKVEAAAVEKKDGSKYPKDALAKCTRIPQGILDQNGGNECTDREAAAFAKVGWSGETAVEISSTIKYGLLERPTKGKVQPTDRARKIIRPQEPKEKIAALREAVLAAPVINEFYRRYRGENLPDHEFLVNAAVDSFGVPKENVEDFLTVFIQTLKDAQLLEEVTGGKTRVLDVAPVEAGTPASEDQLKKLSKGVTVSATDTCFVVMPFADPIGGYYTSIYQPAIDLAKLKAVRADADIYGTGKIIDQIWNGINNARVLIAELTGRNPNVLYELGIAHALKKPVVLVSSNEPDVPFDVRHVRVIYYDMRDPFWGKKLIEKVAENIVSALKNPAEAILFPDK